MKPFTIPTFVQPVKIENSNGNVLITTGGSIEGGGRNTFTETGYIQTFFQRRRDRWNQTVKTLIPGYNFLAQGRVPRSGTGKIEGDGHALHVL